MIQKRDSSSVNLFLIVTKEINCQIIEGFQGFFAQIRLAFRNRPQLGECSLVGMLLGMFCEYLSSCHLYQDWFYDAHDMLPRNNTWTNCSCPGFKYWVIRDSLRAYGVTQDKMSHELVGSVQIWCRVWLYLNNPTTSRWSKRRQHNHQFSTMPHYNSVRPSTKWASCESLLNMRSAPPFRWSFHLDATSTIVLSSKTVHLVVPRSAVARLALQLQMFDWAWRFQDLCKLHYW